MNVISRYILFGDQEVTPELLMNLILMSLLLQRKQANKTSKCHKG